jgi:hypothetical protein
VIDVDGEQITEDSDADTIVLIAYGAHGSKVRKTLRICGISPLTIRPVGNLCHAAVLLFQLPVTELISDF